MSDELSNVEFHSAVNGNDNGKSRKSLSEAKEMLHDYEDVLKLIGFGKTQWIVLITSGLLLWMVINETMGMSIITIASQCDFATNSVDKAVMSAASFVGILCSSYFWGYLSDTKGRRLVLVYATFTANIVSFISIFIANYWAFIFLRFVVGIFIAGASSTTYAYLGEFFISKNRPVVINYASMFVGIAMAYVPAVAWLISAMDWSLPISDTFDFRPWRLLTIFYLLPGFVAALILLTLPESPRILLALDKEAEALQAVNWICLRNSGRTLNDLQVYKLKGEPKLQHENIFITTKSAPSALKKMWRETRPLFKSPHVANFLISCTIMCGLFFSSSGMGLWYTEIQNRVGSNPNDELLTVCQVIDASMVEKAQNSSETLCDDSISSKSYIDSITFGMAYIVGFIVLGMVINPLGRKAVIIGFLFLSSIFGFSLHWIVHPTAIVVAFVLFLILPGLCISVLSGALVDLVPTHLRGKAVCLGLMLGRSGSVIGSNIIGVLLESYCSWTFSVFSGFVLVCAALTFVLPI